MNLSNPWGQCRLPEVFVSVGGVPLPSHPSPEPAATSMGLVPLTMRFLRHLAWTDIPKECGPSWELPVTLSPLGQSLFPGAQHTPPLEELPGLSSLCPSLLNQPKSKAQPLLPGLGGPPEMVWAQLSFPQAHGQSQKQLGPNCL